MSAASPSSTPAQGAFRKFRERNSRILPNIKARIGVGLLLAFVLLAVLAPVISPYSPTYTGFSLGASPSPAHLLGTTRSGQDILSQLIWGTRPSLDVSLTTGSITMLVAVAIGILAGLLEGIIDEILMLATNIVLVLPSIVLVIVISSYISAASDVTISFIIALTSWPWGARVIRAQTLHLKSKDFVKAAIASGENHFRVAFFEILPNMFSLVAANFFFTCLYAVVTVASLQFLGLGNINAISWGSILYWANNSNALMIGAWWWFLPPGLAIGLLGAAFALINFGIDELTNPRLRREGP